MPIMVRIITLECDELVDICIRFILCAVGADADENRNQVLPAVVLQLLLRLVVVLHLQSNIAAESKKEEQVEEKDESKHVSFSLVY
ncbi:hypothetical protein CTI12_AA008860 [Artemisia annua]|uniref:Uncharacterized protein n=1 Tax=Artemisia annua TaxID=35608 RepID=A0A2U1QN08_ARTAN|nr:hypothetical protein CTI12_AA008860 [Artemisia annua]